MFFRLNQQSQFPNFSKNHAHQFLHACLWNVKDTKKAFQKYCQIRTGSPDLFANRDPMTDKMQNVLNIAFVNILIFLKSISQKLIFFLPNKL